MKRPRRTRRLRQRGHGFGAASLAFVALLRAEASRGEGLPGVSLAVEMEDPALESRLVGQARERIRNGDPAGALRVLREADVRIPGGTLAQEREVLAVEALVGTGEIAAAETRAAAFLTAHPHSALAARVRAVIER
ncbi:MAG: hypothetical protein JW751_09420 [Polyangiaceae bacterium]|nr:hypothetical protein [Polyangiaceae bacterium]